MINIGIIPGRFQPPTKGHLELFDFALAENDIVFAVVIRGDKTGEDKERNPLPFWLQEKIIKMARPAVEVIQFPTGNIPKMSFNVIKRTQEKMHSFDKGYNLSIYTGPDRKAAYIAQTKDKYIEQLKTDLGDKSLNIEMGVKDSPRHYEGTKVRELIRAGKDEEAKQMMATDDEEIYNEVKKYIVIEEKINSILGVL